MAYLKNKKVIIIIIMIICFCIIAGCQKPAVSNNVDMLADLHLPPVEKGDGLTSYQYERTASPLPSSGMVEGEYIPGELPIKLSAKVPASEIEPERVIYLTFDDGPSVMTPGFLDVLKENNVQATFCVIGERVLSYPDIIKRAYEEGHSIISHSHTHVINEIYKSPGAFLDSIEKSNAAIDSLIKRKEIEVSFLRFPGGAVKSYKPIADLLKTKGYNTLDWNIDSGDCKTGLATAQYIRNNSVKDGGRDILVLLMHDYKYRKTTIDALPDIISHYRDKGYIFRTIRDMPPGDFERLKRIKVVNILH